MKNASTKNGGKIKKASAATVAKTEDEIEVDYEYEVALWERRVLGRGIDASAEFGGGGGFGSSNSNSNKFGRNNSRPQKQINARLTGPLAKEMEQILVRHCGFAAPVY